MIDIKPDGRNLIPEPIEMTQEDAFLQFLRSISGRHVDFFPNPGNAGDGVIAYATYEMFRRYNISVTPHRQEETVGADLVLAGGGGNLVEGRYNQMADIIRRHSHVERVVLLPHTIVGFADVLAQTHTNLTVFCREPVSYDLALANGASKERTFLSQDMALFLSDDHFSEFFQPGSGTLRALRKDGESAKTIPVGPDNIDLSLSWNGDLWGSGRFSMYVTKSLAAYLARYALVQTDRMHLAILGALLQKQVHLLPNAYFKSEAVFRHSLQERFPQLRFIDDPSAIEPAGEDTGVLDAELSPGGAHLEPAQTGRRPRPQRGPSIGFRQFLDRRAKKLLSPHLRRQAHPNSFLPAFGAALFETADLRLQRLRFFSQKDYFEQHPDVAVSGMRASDHALRYGMSENRRVFKPQTIARVLARAPVPTAVEFKQGHPPSSALQQKPVRLYVSSLGNRYMAEIAEALAGDLRQVGINASIGNEQDRIEDIGGARLFVAPHEFFSLGRGREWLRPDVFRSAFLFNTEQAQTHWFATTMPAILAARGVFDLSPQNASVFREAGIPSMHWEPSTKPRAVWLRDTDWEHPLIRVLQTHKSEQESANWDTRPIDICFFGNESPRRHVALARYAEPFSQYSTYIYCRGQARGPMLERSQEEPLTRIAGFVSSRSRISLNIHRDDFPYFEWHRMVHHGMASGAVVVTDPCLPHPTWKPGIHYVEENVRQIPNVIDWLLKSPDGRSKAKEIRSNVANLLSQPVGVRDPAAGAATLIGQVMGWMK
ncbi:polysaccharide pyruvyl transferase family protein [Mesorhizobium sp. KR9-304]|uniref:polysaccharide pyruvyl transferase family protein n=1 Tax=Mesorhizobium sp. KR9-304 TaxID=3156614 RepID=UPI0032B33BF1